MSVGKVREDSAFFQLHHALYVVSMGEHIHGLGAEDLVSALYQHVKVTGKSFRIAGDINHALGAHMDERVQKSLIAAGSGGIHKHNVGAFALGITC